VIAAAMIVIPIVSEGVAEPPIYYYVDADYNVRQVNFVAEQGDELTFTIDPLTEPEDYTFEALDTLDGYVANDNQLVNTSWDSINAARGALDREEFVPADYDLNVAVNIQNRDREVVAESDFTEGSTENVSFTWEAPDDGWFTFTIVLNEENPGTMGRAWLRVDDLEVFFSTYHETLDRHERFGEEPLDYDCTGCGTSANRTDLRFQGSRTFGQYFSLQLSPYLRFVRQFFFIGLVAGAAGYIVAKGSRRSRVPITEDWGGVEWLLWSVPAVMVVFWFVFMVILPAVGLDVSFSPTAIIAAFAVAAVLAAGYYLYRNDWQVDSQKMGMMFGAGLVMMFLFVGVRLVLLERIPVEAGLTLTLGMAVFGFVYSVMQFVRNENKYATRGSTVLWIVALPIAFVLISGFQGNQDLPRIDASVWGGLLLTLVLSTIAIVAAFPLGIGLALGRQSELPAIKLVCTVLIEVIRGVPLITLLFMGRYIVSFFHDSLSAVDLYIRIIIVLTLFDSAYLAEVIRGGLQIVPPGQIEAGRAIGLNNFQVTAFIVLPQALRAVIPAIMGQFISLFKDTSLVAYIGMFEITGAMRKILSDTATGYSQFPREGWLYIGILYFVFSFILAEASRKLEETGAGAVRRDTI
jgi:general L-amino acid transport system permease protein